MPSQGEKLYAVTETYKCIPDPVQVIAGCTFGNHRLQVLPIGKFALTMNRPSEKKVVEGVRVYVDVKKLKKFRIINAWYTHSPGFDSSEMIYPLIDQILVAGRDILSFQRVNVNVPRKESWKSVPCSILRGDGPRCHAGGKPLQGMRLDVLLYGHSINTEPTSGTISFFF